MIKKDPFVSQNFSLLSFNEFVAKKIQNKNKIKKTQIKSDREKKR